MSQEIHGGEDKNGRTIEECYARENRLCDLSDDTHLR
jgi:hypothetical protein